MLAIKTLHDNKLVHRNIHHGSFIFHKDVLLLLQFNFIYYKEPNEKLSDIVGMLYYMAPEMLK